MKKNFIACMVSVGYGFLGIIAPYAIISWILFFNAVVILLMSLFWRKIIETADNENFCEISQTLSFMPRVFKNKRGFFINLNKQAHRIAVRNAYLYNI